MTGDSAMRARIRGAAALWLVSCALWPVVSVAQSDVAFPASVYAGRRAALVRDLPVHAWEKR